MRDVAKRREIIHDVERHLGKPVYRAEAYSIAALAVWDPALKNYGPNLGYDYGATPCGLAGPLTVSSTRC